MVRIEIARAPWATSGLKIVTGKIPLPLPSLRDADHAGLEVSRAKRFSLKSMSNPGGGLQRGSANYVIEFFNRASGTTTIQNAVRETSR